MKEEEKNNMESNDTTEQYKGIIMLRKGKLEEKDVWFGTVGNMLISDGAFETKEALIENLENITLDRICKIMIGVFDRALKIQEGK